MQILSIEPKNQARFHTYIYLYGALQALTRPHESVPHNFTPGEQILGIEDINNIVTIHYRSKAALVQYSGLVLDAWKRVASSLEVPFLRHSTPDGALVIGDPNCNPDASDAASVRGFDSEVYPKDRDRSISLGLVIGALKLGGYPRGYADTSPELIGRHISRMGWESGVVFVEWTSSEAFLAYGYIAMYAWRVAGYRPAPGTIRHVLPDGSRIECNLWDEDPWKGVARGNERNNTR